MKGTFFFRFGALAALGILLVGPTPGEAGACGDDVEFADREQFCLEREYWTCAREGARQGWPNEDIANCIVERQMTCAGFAFACDPPPTTRQTDACIASLRSADRLGTPTELIGECDGQVLCNNVSLGLSAGDAGQSETSAP